MAGRHAALAPPGPVGRHPVSPVRAVEVRQLPCVERSMCRVHELCSDLAAYTCRRGRDASWGAARCGPPGGEPAAHCGAISTRDGGDIDTESRSELGMGMSVAEVDENEQGLSVRTQTPPFGCRERGGALAGGGTGSEGQSRAHRHPTDKRTRAASGRNGSPVENSPTRSFIVSVQRTTSTSLGQGDVDDDAVSSARCRPPRGPMYWPGRGPRGRRPSGVCRPSCCGPSRGARRGPGTAG